MYLLPLENTFQSSTITNNFMKNLKFTKIFHNKDLLQCDVFQHSDIKIRIEVALVSVLLIETYLKSK